MAARDDELTARLVAAGQRVTEQRLRVLRALSALDAPISHTELADKIADDHLDRATIFRNLVALAKSQVLIRTQLGDAVWRYELARSTTTHGVHPHFVCNDCGDVLCVPMGAVAVRKLGGAEVAEIQLRGRCAECVVG